MHARCARRPPEKLNRDRRGIRPRRCFSNGAAETRSLEDRAGFSRPMKEDLRNTVEPYGRHVFICTSVRADRWPEKPAIENPFFMSLLSNLKNVGATGPSTVRVTLSEEPDGAALPAPPVHDLMVFPDMVKLPGITESHLPQLAAQLVASTPHWPVPTRSLSGHWFFVCAHAQTDERCGYCGPILARQLQELTKGRNDVHIRRCSHIGGHKFAGNVLAFPQGDWYGYVTPTNLPNVLSAVLKGEMHTPLLRGQMHPRAPP